MHMSKHVWDIYLKEAITFHLKMNTCTDMLMSLSSLILHRIQQTKTDWTHINRHPINTQPHTSVWPKVIKKSVNKLITSWQLPTKKPTSAFPPPSSFSGHASSSPCYASPLHFTSIVFVLITSKGFIHFLPATSLVYYCCIYSLLSLLSLFFSPTTISVLPQLFFHQDW